MPARRGPKQQPWTLTSSPLPTRLRCSPSEPSSRIASRARTSCSSFSVRQASCGPARRAEPPRRLAPTGRRRMQESDAGWDARMKCASSFRSGSHGASSEASSPQSPWALHRPIVRCDAVARSRAPSGAQAALVGQQQRCKRPLSGQPCRSRKAPITVRFAVSWRLP